MVLRTRQVRLNLQSLAAMNFSQATALRAGLQLAVHLHHMLAVTTFAQHRRILF
jgi:hypothetical protein